MPLPGTATRAPPIDAVPARADRPLLRAQRLGFAIDGRTLWQGLELALHAGERLAVVGASGSGKTLLLRTLAGLEPLQSGDLAFDGRALSQWPMPAYRARVVYVAQRPALHEGPVEAALQAPFGFRVHHQQRYSPDRARELLALLGRDENFMLQRTERLSGGEGQIVAMLRALLIAPDVLLLDEPTASLDAGAVAAIETLVANWLQERPERACVWTSHDRQQLERISDRTLLLGPAA